MITSFATIGDGGVRYFIQEFQVHQGGRVLGYFCLFFPLIFSSVFSYFSFLQDRSSFEAIGRGRRALIDYPSFVDLS